MALLTYDDFYEQKPIIERFLNRQGVTEAGDVAHDVLATAWERGAHHRFDSDRGTIVAFLLGHAAYYLKGFRKTQAISFSRERLMESVPDTPAPDREDLTEYLDSIRSIADKLCDTDAETLRVSAAGYLLDGEWRVEALMSHLGISRTTAYNRMEALRRALVLIEVVTW